MPTVRSRLLRVAQQLARVHLALGHFATPALRKFIISYDNNSLHTVFDGSREDSDAVDASPTAPATCGAEGSSDLPVAARDLNAEPRAPNGMQSSFLREDVFPRLG